MLSWRLAPLSVRPSGVPRASVTRWRLMPGLARSVGFGPTSAPPFLQPGWRCRVPPGSSPAPLRPAVAPAAPGAASPRPRPRATRPAAASRSCRSTQARSAPRATECPFGERTGSRPGPHGPVHAVDHLWTLAAPAAAVAPPPPRDRQQRGAPSPLNVSGAVLSRTFSSTLAIRRRDRWRRPTRAGVPGEASPSRVKPGGCKASGSTMAATGLRAGGSPRRGVSCPLRFRKGRPS